MLERIAFLAAAARAAGVPVVYVQADDAGEEGSEPWQIHPAIAPAPGETVIRKRACDAFYGTNLHEHLQALKIDHLVVAGAKTEYCVDSVCRRATTIAHANWTFDGFDNLENYVQVLPATEVPFA